MVVVGRQDVVAGCGEAARRRVGRGVGAAAVAALVAFPIARAENSHYFVLRNS